jgi:glyoxylase-like metal-dependent hydrolase (beta-lactamase superfamily II)
LRDGGKEALFTGDVMHHPVQVYNPDWSSQFCWDREMSARSRRQVLEHSVEHNSLLCPAHFPGPNAGYIKEKAGHFSMEWDRA